MWCITAAFLLSKHILCKENIVNVRKFDFEILTHLYFRSPEFIYAIFMVMYVCVCVYVCMWVNTIVSKRRIQLSLNLVCILLVTVGRTLLFLVSIGWIVFLQEHKKKSYTLWPMDSNFLKFSCIQTVHFIELKYGMYITSHRLTYCVDFCEFRINSFFTGVQKNILIHYGLWSQIL